MKKPLCPVCKKRPRRQYASRLTVTCKIEQCRKLYYYLLAQTARPKKKLKCKYCKKLFVVPKGLTRKRYTCGKSACITKHRLKFIKEWKKQNPLLVAKQKQRWKARQQNKSFKNHFLTS